MTTQKNHVAIIPLAAFSPCSHMGHAIDLGILLDTVPGVRKHVGISSKADLFSPELRRDIFEKQIQGVKTPFDIQVRKTAGETIRAAFKDVAAEANRVLHIVVGDDRKDKAEELKKSILACHHGLPWNAFSEVHIHTPGTKRPHGLSGTKMRQAAFDGNMEIFEKHMGNMWMESDLQYFMYKIRQAIIDGELTIQRN